MTAARLCIPTRALSWLTGRPHVPPKKRDDGRGSASHALHTSHILSPHSPLLLLLPLHQDLVHSEAIHVHHLEAEARNGDLISFTGHAV